MPHRLFLSHATEDKADVQRLRRALADRGIGAWEVVLELRLGGKLDDSAGRDRRRRRVRPPAHARNRLARTGCSVRSPGPGRRRPSRRSTRSSPSCAG